MVCKSFFCNFGPITVRLKARIMTLFFRRQKDNNPATLKEAKNVLPFSVQKAGRAPGSL